MSGLTLTVLGCAGSYPGPGGACSGYLVRSAGATTVLDMGSGTLANLQKHAAIGDLDAVVLTHEHPDHWLDLSLLRNAMKYVLGLEGLPVYGPAGVLEKASGLLDDLAPTLRWTTIDADSTVQVGDQTLRFSLTDHPVETLAVRVEAGGRTLAYSADSGVDWAAGPTWLAGVDLFLCEATMPTEMEGRIQHLSAREAGVLAHSGGVGRLVLTHISPGLDITTQRTAAASAFTGPLDVAATHRTYVV